MKRFLGVMILTMTMLVPVLGQADGPPMKFSMDLTGLVLENPCEPEWVTVTGGTMQVQIHAFSDEAGGSHFQQHNITQNVSGVGNDTGLDYRVSSTSNTTYNLPASGAFERVFASQLNVIQQGGSNSSVSKILMKVSRDANDVVRVSFVKTEPVMSCPSPE